MTHTHQFSCVCTRSVVVAALLLSGIPGMSHAQEEVVYVSVVDSVGVPVTDMTADEVIVRWNGQTAETVEFVRLGWPVRLSVFLDNSHGAYASVTDMREGFQLMLEGLPEDVEVSLSTIGRQVRSITEHTTDRAALTEGVGLVARDTGSGPRFLDALVEAVNQIDDDDDREYFPVIVVVSADGGDSSSSQQGRVDNMIRQIQENAVEIHVLLFMSGDGQGAAAIQGQFGNVLGQNTGGSFETVTISSGFRGLLQDLGNQLATKHSLLSNQYRVTYRPPSESSRPAITVVTTRPRVRMTSTLDGNISLPQ